MLRGIFDSMLQKVHHDMRATSFVYDEDVIQANMKSTFPNEELVPLLGLSLQECHVLGAHIEVAQIQRYVGHVFHHQQIHNISTQFAL
jgi:hypothetical protein